MGKKRLGVIGENSMDDNIKSRGDSVVAAYSEGARVIILVNGHARKIIDGRFGRTIEIIFIEECRGNRGGIVAADINKTWVTGGSIMTGDTKESFTKRSDLGIGIKGSN